MIIFKCTECDAELHYEDDVCQECCPHDEHDHGICLDCGKDNTDHFVGMAESYYEGER